MIYSQRDHLWAEKQLGNSGLTMASFGCLITDMAQMLTDAGYNVTPGDMVDHLSSINGFTDDNYPQGSGLLIWYKLTEAYPQVHYHGANSVPGSYAAFQGNWGKYQHYVLKNLDGVITEPFYGREGEPVGFKETGYVIYLSVDAVNVAPVSPAAPTLPPVGVNLQPDAEWNKLNGGADRYQNRDEVKHLQDLLIAEESISAYDQVQMQGDGHGYFGPITVRAVVEFQISKGIMLPGSEYPATYAAGFVGVHTRAALNP